MFGETHLRRIVGAYAAYYYYNESRTHRSLDKDAPFHRAIQRLGAILQNLIFGTDTANCLITEAVGALDGSHR